MKKILLTAVIMLITSALVFAGGKKDKGTTAGSGEAPFIVDLSKITQMQVIDQDKSVIGGPVPGLRSPALTKPWQGYFIQFPENFVDVTKYQRVTITLKYFDIDGKDLTPADGMGMCVFIYDIKGDWSGPAMGPGPNTPLKEMNIGGFSGMVHKEKGVRHGCTKAPSGIFIQKAQNNRVAFIELGEIIFHNSNFKFSEPQPEGSGPEES